MSVEKRWNDADSRKLKYSKKNPPQYHCPPQIPHGLDMVITKEILCPHYCA
jgi:hypothetical protein